MTKRETGYTVQGLKVWAAAGLMLILVLSSGPALAAQIDITNCTSSWVKICSYDQKGETFESPTGVHALDAWDGNSTPAKGHFTCNANCYFRFNEHTGHGCEEGNSWHWLDHGWGSGDYLLVSLDRTSGGKYKSGDLTKGSSCP